MATLQSGVSISVGAYDIWNRFAIFPQAASNFTVSSVEIYMGAGLQSRAAIYASDYANSTLNATLVWDAGVFTGGGADGYVTVTAPGGTTFPSGKYPILIERPAGNIALDEITGGYPVGNTIYSGRSEYGGSVSTAFASTAVTDDGVDSPARVIVGRINYTAGSASAKLLSMINNQSGF